MVSLFSLFGSELKCMRPKDSKAELKKLGEMDPEGQLIIRDPYYVSIRPLSRGNTLDC